MKDRCFSSDSPRSARMHAVLGTRPFFCFGEQSGDPTPPPEKHLSPVGPPPRRGGGPTAKAKRGGPKAG